MFTAFVFACFLQGISYLQRPPLSTSRPVVVYLNFPATSKQPFVFTVQRRSGVERIHAQLWARNRVTKRWTCINYDLSHPVQRSATVQECGVLLPPGHVHTLRYTLSAADIYLLRDLDCVTNNQSAVKIKSCTTWGRNYEDSKETRLLIL
jgi:hypothetical protein